MDAVEIAAFLFGGFTILILFGVPIAHSLGAISLLLLLVEGIPAVSLPQTVYHATDQFPLIAVPFFVLAGYLMQYGGVSKRLIDFAASLVGHVTGGFASVTILACMFFAAMSGSGPATVAAIGTIMIPAMIRSGYSAPFAGAVASTGGTLGIMIPPSTPMIIYAVIGNVSVTQMFIAGIVPGILTGLVLILGSWWFCRSKGYTAREKRSSLREIGTAMWNARWALMAPVIVLGGIYGGIFTPTEASIVAVNYALIVGFFVYRKLTLENCAEAFFKAVMVAGTVTIIVGLAGAFGRLLTQYQIPQMVSEAVLAQTSNPYLILIIIAIGLIIIGTFMETLATIVLLTPILLPVCMSVGIDPIHFGILLVVTSEIGFLTPPLGANLFIAMPIANVTLEQLSRAVLPYIFLLCLIVLLLIFVPSLSTGLIQIFYR